MDNELDDEARASVARSALDGLANLFEGQVPGFPLASEETAALLRVVGSFVKQTIPSHEPKHPAGANDVTDL